MNIKLISLILIVLITLFFGCTEKTENSANIVTQIIDNNETEPTMEEEEIKEVRITIQERRVLDEIIKLSRMVEKARIDGEYGDDYFNETTEQCQIVIEELEGLKKYMDEHPTFMCKHLTIDIQIMIDYYNYLLMNLENGIQIPDELIGKESE